MKILYYVSSHGYGHISRSMEIIRTLYLNPQIESVTVACERLDFIKETHSKLHLRNVSLDIGVHQKDSISLDVDATLAKLENFEKQKPQLLDNEAEFNIRGDFDLIVSDSASLPFVIGVQAKIPTLFVGNFTWDYIYQNFAKYNPYFAVIANIIKIEYSFATAACILPFACPIGGFLESSRIGLVGRNSKLSKQEARNLFNFNNDETYFLFSFGAYGLKDVTWNWQNKPSDWKIVCSELSGFESDQILNLGYVYYPDLVKAVDYVVTKPGYGIISESILAETPMIYTDRGDFAEYPHLVQALQKEHPSSYISQQDLRNFAFSTAMETILAFKRTSSQPISLNGEMDVLNWILLNHL